MPFHDLMIPPFDDETELIPIQTDEEDDESHLLEVDGDLPLLPLRNTVVFPGVVLPITVGRDSSILAVKAANRADKLIAVVSQIDASVEDPNQDDLHEVGTVARIIKVLKMPDGSTTCIIQGKRTMGIDRITSYEPFLKARVTMLDEVRPDLDDEFQAHVATITDLGREIIERSNQIPTEASVVLDNIRNPFFLVNFVATNLSIEVVEKQRLLETADLRVRANKVLEAMQRELQMLKLKNKIQSKTQTDIEKQQRDYFLHQQLKTIQEELGGDSPHKDVERLEERAAEVDLPKEARAVFDKELAKLKRTNPASAEYPIVLNYVELLLDLPWGITTDDNLELRAARSVLDDEHYGLTRIKDRILEYLAVLKLKGDLASPILCFVGPPGVGKTSLGKSIAEAMGRKYVRMSLGGLHDESEIRGHRRTYIGAMPGRILQNLKKVGTNNPVFILDEVDKVGNSFRGDPSSALLEVLDPEQNSAFYDNYLEMEYDLSKVLFIATANSLSTIQPALRDRMEIIELQGYSVEEKIEIAVKHLVPNQRRIHGLTAKDVKLSRRVLQHIIENDTRESGVRSLERTIAAVMRAVAKAKLLDEDYKTSLRIQDVRRFLGAPRYDDTHYLDDNPPGVAVGLAYTAVGGRHPLHRGEQAPGQGGPATHRQPRRRDEGVCPVCPDISARPRRGLGHRPGCVRGDGGPRPRAGGGNPQGRPVRGHHHPHDPGVALHGPARAAPPGHDR